METIAIRVDASKEIGTGHVMRCICLGCELRKNGFEIIFVSRKHDGHLGYLIKSFNFNLKFLNKNKSQNKKNFNKNDCPHAEWLGSNWMDDVEETIKALKNYDISYFIIDHYGIDYKWEGFIKSITKKVVVIDDLCDRRHNCNLLLINRYLIIF